MVFGLVAIVLVLICVLIWLNVLMVRRGRKDASSPSHSSAGDAKVNAPENPRETVREEAAPLEGVVREERAPEGPAQEQSPEVAAEPNLGDAVSTGFDEMAPEEARSARVDAAGTQNFDDVEVVANSEASSRGRKLFERKERPYVFHGASVPDFDREDWHQCFYRLTEDPMVMGWIGFQDDTIGASDREYDQGFVETLRTYHRSVIKLQRDVGLSNILETSVVGEEGKVWLLTGNEDVWFALFVDRDADLKKISQGFMAQLTAN